MDSLPKLDKIVAVGKLFIGLWQSASIEIKKRKMMIIIKSNYSANCHL